MRALIVIATDAESAPIMAALGAGTAHGSRMTRYEGRGHQVDMLITGIGMVATAAWCSRALAGGQYGLALNFGVCGSFSSTFAPGTVVHVVSDCIAELGAEDGDRAAFLTAQEIGLLGEDEFPFSGGRLVNATPPASAALERLPSVNGITVNTAHGADESIAAVTRRLQPHVESMEGAAFMYACLIQGVAFAQVRAVSNIVERRNRGAWKLDDAVGRLGAAALDILDQTCI